MDYLVRGRAKHCALVIQTVGKHLTAHKQYQLPNQYSKHQLKQAKPMKELYIHFIIGPFGAF